MRKLAVLLVASIAAISGADATVTVSSTNYGLAASEGDGTLVDFDDSSYAGFDLSGTGYIIQSGSNAMGAAPADGPTDTTDDRTQYLSVFGGRAVLLGANAFTNVSLYWGSIDTYNSLDLLDADGDTIATITSATIAAGNNGDQLSATTNRRVDIASTQAFYGLAFNSSPAAFEADNVKFTGEVPEPASWAMMVGGFGLLGGAMRASRRRTTTVLA